MPVKPKAPTSRNRILESFTELLSQQGYGHTSIGDVAAKAEVSKGTIMHHFVSKEQMLFEVQLSFMSRRLNEAESIARVFTTPVGQLSAMVYSLLRIHRDDPIASRTFMREFSIVTEAPSMEEVRASREKFEGIMRDIIKRGMEEGVFRKADVVMTSMQIFGMCNHAWSWYRPDGPYSLEEICESFLEMVFGGMLAENTEVSGGTVKTILGEAAALHADLDSQLE